MISIDYDLSIPGFPKSEIHLDNATLIRSHYANLQINVTNDGKTSHRKLKVKPVVESYVGQGKPLLFAQLDPQVIENIPPKGMVPLTFNIWAHYPGVIAIAIHLSDANNGVVMAKRKGERETAYQQLPVRYWFYVIDDVYIETLKAVKSLVKELKAHRARGKKK